MLNSYARYKEIVALVSNILTNLSGTTDETDAAMLAYFNNVVRPHTVVGTVSAETPVNVVYRASSILDNDSIQWIPACGMCLGEGRVSLNGAGKERIISCPVCGPGTPQPSTKGWIVTDYTGLVIERDPS